ncbi:MAG: FAD-dependent monooxygenase [Candidatus Diapherotrites archaeon]
MVKINFSKLELGYDVVVIGGGAAGCSFLSNISDEKYNVLLVDYRSFPRFKACSGILVNNAKKYFDGINIPSSIMAKPVDLHLTYQDWTHNKENKVEKHFVNTYRKKLDELLFSEVKKRNISILEETKLIDFFYTKDKKHTVVVLESNGMTKSIVTKNLIGCDGALSLVRKKIYPRNIPYYVAMQETIPDHKIDRAFFIFDEDITDFYCWLIPKDDGVEIGAAVSPFKARETFQKFKKKVAEKTGIKGDGKIESAIILRPESSSDFFLGENSVFLCGEAAGLISPSSAEGISYALISGKLCAEALNSEEKNPIVSYKKKCKTLLDRLNEKLLKSKKISHSKNRKTLFS